MYNLSKDYKELYKRLCEGHEAFALVDYTWPKPNIGNIEVYPFRDTVRVRRKEKWKISVGVRGRGYGDVEEWHKEQFKTELDAFIYLCNDLNLEWVKP